MLTLLELINEPISATMIATHGLTVATVALMAVLDPSAQRRNEARMVLALLLGRDRNDR
ncbi:hypothetical protein IPZ58_36250 [Streptomyces roseoverticillatus]|uniref:hypothetical protein n=1 Tax=Streptomyces roseoverticillatus TaxID=66429 RepID=UPI001F406BC9|nr:hypothetical protein [Streptomyces roseoverticillatus]MCF3106970.1 hypothetical protein [Streptomyces roseoverticillatus]